MKLLRNRDYLFLLACLASIAWMTASCKKKAPEPLTPRSYDLPDWDEESDDDLPEAEEEDAQALSGK
jgi:hypothetical protein